MESEPTPQAIVTEEKFEQDIEQDGTYLPDIEGEEGEKHRSEEQE